MAEVRCPSPVSITVENGIHCLLHYGKNGTRNLVHYVKNGHLSIIAAYSIKLERVFVRVLVHQGEGAFLLGTVVGSIDNLLANATNFRREWPLDRQSTLNSVH